MKEKFEYKRVREIREEKRETQKEVADELGLYLTQYRRYETGETEIPAHIIKKICQRYNVSADYILGLSDEFKTLK